MTLTGNPDRTRLGGGVISGGNIIRELSPRDVSISLTSNKCFLFIILA